MVVVSAVIIVVPDSVPAAVAVAVVVGWIAHCDVVVAFVDGGDVTVLSLVLCVRLWMSLALSSVAFPLVLLLCMPSLLSFIVCCFACYSCCGCGVYVVGVVVVRVAVAVAFAAAAAVAVGGAASFGLHCNETQSRRR